MTEPGSLSRNVHWLLLYRGNQTHLAPPRLLSRHLSKKGQNRTNTCTGCLCQSRLQVPEGPAKRFVFIQTFGHISAKATALLELPLCARCCGKHRAPVGSMPSRGFHHKAAAGATLQSSCSSSRVEEDLWLGSHCHSAHSGRSPDQRKGTGRFG